MKNLFKIYVIFILTLIFTQIVIARDGFISFHHEMRNYDNKKQRKPNTQEKDKSNKSNIIELKNKELIINTTKSNKDVKND